MAKLNNRTITAVQQIITGNETPKLGKISPYRSGPDLVQFFNQFGFNDSYTYGGFPSRWDYTESRLSEANETELIGKIIEHAVAAENYHDTEFTVKACVDYLNGYLALDDLELVNAGRNFRLVYTGEKLVASETLLEPEKFSSHQYISEQLSKCSRKLIEEDYDGAITNARTALEAVLVDLETKLNTSALPYDGDLPKLYKRVQKLLNLDPERPDIEDSLRQVLRGLTSVIGGLAPMRNKMGDAHARYYKPCRHHAKLAVNSAITILDFLYDTYNYQQHRGLIVQS